jgi:hypothetical protein
VSIITSLGRIGFNPAILHLDNSGSSSFRNHSRLTFCNSS